MSYMDKKEVKCPMCEHVFETSIFISVNVQDNPLLKEMILNGELNVIMCPECKNIFYFEEFLLYLDPAEELLVFVYPQMCEIEKERYIEIANQEFEMAQSLSEEDERIKYKPKVVFGLDRLVELINKENVMREEEEVVENICQNLNLEYIKVSPYIARENNIPRLIPMEKKVTTDIISKITKAIERLLEYTPTLEEYKNFFENMKEEVFREKIVYILKEILESKNNGER